MNPSIFPAIFLAVLCLAGAALPLQVHAQEHMRQISFDKSADEPYALVREGQRTTFVGRYRNDDPEVQALNQQQAGNFLWFRQSGKAYIVREPATLARVAAAWAPADKLGEDMDKFNARMQVHSAAMNALGKEMSATVRGPQTNRGATEAIGKRMDALGQTMDALGKQMTALGKQIERDTKLADATTRTLLQNALASGAAQPAINH